MKNSKLLAAISLILSVIIFGGAGCFKWQDLSEVPIEIDVRIGCGFHQICDSLNVDIDLLDSLFVDMTGSGTMDTTTNTQTDIINDTIVSDSNTIITPGPPKMAVSFHLVGDPDFTGFHSADIRASLDTFNVHFLPFIMLYEKMTTELTSSEVGGINNIQDVFLDGMLEAAAFDPWHDYNSINVFIVPGVERYREDCKCFENLLGYTYPPVGGLSDQLAVNPYANRIIMTYEAVANHQTFTHELGHWLGAWHDAEQTNYMAALYRPDYWTHLRAGQIDSAVYVLKSKREYLVKS